jgi:hypothetical protein
MKNKILKNPFIKFLFYFIIVIIIYKIITYIGISMIEYEEPTHIKNIFTDNEIEIMQACTNNSIDITTKCYKELHTNLLNKIKNKLNKNNLYVHHARFSNNNNGDGQSFHKDVKPNLLYNRDYPNVYTIILYLDPAGIYVGNKKIMVSPGDIVIFNSFHLHKSVGLDPFSSTHQRRVLQLFNCFFDETVKNEFFKRTSYCDHFAIPTFNKYLNYFIDLRWYLEYANLTKLYMFSNKCDKIQNPDFFVFLNEKNYITTIDSVRYYRDI